MAIELDAPAKPIDPLTEFGVTADQRAGGIEKPGMTPADIIAAENAANAEGQEHKEGTEQKETPAEPQVKVGEVDVDALLKKVEANEPLNAAEMDALKIINAPPAPPPPEKTYRVAGQDIKRTEALQKAKEHFSDTLGADLNLAPDAEDKLIDDWYKLQNRTAQQITVQKSSEQNARDRKEIEVARERVRIEQAKLDARSEMLTQEADRIKREKERLTRDANVDIKKEDIQDEDQRILYQRKVAASERLQSLSEDEQRLQQQQSEVNNQSFRALIGEFQVAQPAYLMSAPIETMLAKYKDGTLSENDKIILLELDQLAKEAVNSNTRIEDLYLLKSKQGVLAVPKLQRSAQPTVSGSETPAGVTAEPNLNQSQTLAEKVRAYKAAQLKNPDLIGGGGVGGDSRQSVVPTAKEIVRAGQAAIGTDKASTRATLDGLGLPGY